MPDRKLTLNQLETALDDLERTLDALTKEDPASAIKDSFADQVEVIARKVADGDLAYFSNRVLTMVRDSGLMPGVGEHREPSDEPTLDDDQDA